MPNPEGGDAASVYLQLSRSGEHMEVAPEYRYYPAAAPNDPAYPGQWHLQTIDVEGAWARGTGSGVTVAVIDTGVGTDGLDLACKPFVAPYNTITDNATIAGVDDDSSNGHGTHVTGTVGECTNNAVAAAGVA